MTQPTEKKRPRNTSRQKKLYAGLREARATQGQTILDMICGYFYANPQSNAASAKNAAKESNASQSRQAP